MVVSNSNVFISWHGFISDENPKEEIFFRKSNDNGNTFKPVTTITIDNVYGYLNLKLISTANAIYLIFGYSNESKID